MKMLTIVADKLVPHAHKWWALVLIFLISLVSSLLAVASLGVDALSIFSKEALTIASLVSATCTAVAYFVFRLPKCPNDVIGLLLVITTETETERLRLKNDFAESIKTALNESGNALKFKVFLLPSRLSNSIGTIDEASELTKRCNMRFTLYGNIRTRCHKGTDFYVLKLVSFVTHSITDEQNTRLLQMEMVNLLPAESRIDCKDDLTGFELTSQQFAAGAKYIISIALFLSGRTEHSIQLLRAMYDSLNVFKRQAELPGTNKLINLIPLRLTNFIFHSVQTMFWQWRKSHDPDLLDKIDQALASIPKECSSDYGVLTFKALCSFQIRRDIQESERLSRLADLLIPNSPQSKYSLAFLAAYQGDLDKAYRLYRTAFGLDNSDHLSVEIEEFIARVLEDEPDKYQLHFCLGLINLKKKRDSEQASLDFKLFMDKATQDSYPRQIHATKKYLLELEESD